MPQLFKNVLVRYFQEMKADGKLPDVDCESLSMMFLSMNFGFVFLDASFGKQLTELEKEKYIRESVHVFVQGIS